MLSRIICYSRARSLRVTPLHAQVTAAISGRVTRYFRRSDSRRDSHGEEPGDRSIPNGDHQRLGRLHGLSLPLGPQEVKAEKLGFNPRSRTGVTLVVGQEAVVNLVLTIGELSERVVVTDETPLVNTTTSAVSGVVGEQQIKDLPLNGRSFDNLITLNPGAVNYSAMKSAETSTSNGNTFSVDGRRTYENLFLLNGIEYTGSSQLAISPGGVSGELLGIDAIREFNVLTDTYGAEYGKRAGAQISVVTQSGTNQLHGSLFEFLRNSDLDARNFFDQASVPPFRRNQFGGSLGGPIKKDKWFLFGNYEGFRQVLAESNVSVVPDADARQGLLPMQRRLHSVRQAESRDAELHAAVAAAQRAGTIVGRTAQRHSAFLQQSQANRSRGFRHRANGLHPQRTRHFFGRLHHRRRRQPDSPSRPAVWIVRNIAQPGGQPGRDACYFARNPQHVPRRVFARRVQL